MKGGEAMGVCSRTAKKDEKRQNMDGSSLLISKLARDIGPFKKYCRQHSSVLRWLSNAEYRTIT